MVGFDTEAGIIKHYRVDMMSEIVITEARRDGQEHFERFDMAMYSRGVFGMFGGEEETVRMRFANHLIGVVVDRFGRDVFISREDEDHFSVSVKVAVSPHFLSWVFGFGDEAGILSPEHVIEQFRRQAALSLSQYG
jgi:predicted DNA-binding transcriptional regulator YafY